MEQIITKEMTIMDIIQINPHLSKVLEANGMHCVGCMSALSENLEEAAAAHEIELEPLLNRLNILANALKQQ